MSEPTGTADGWKVEQHGRVRWLCLDRAARKNAMTTAMGIRLGELVAEARADEGTRVLVLTGEGDAFSAGLDKDEIASGLGDKSHFPVEAFYDFPKPTIACVNGLAYGGGATLAVACDLRVVADSAAISDWHRAQLGSGLGGWGASTRLARPSAWRRPRT